ncbi:manganese catalase family protein [Deinococcus altitudinis]|uniref:manganese catalase family protein n=1 Tax=Deinococcus altitudinis TaxID=468914 RepID=UPI003891C87A
MFLRIDKLQYDLPEAKEQDPNAAAAIQELMGGRFGEMSTLMNYMTQSFNFRGKKELRPYYDLISNIAAEELGHIELVSAAINSLLAGPDTKAKEKPVDPSTSPLSGFLGAQNLQHFIAGGPGTLIQDSRGMPWTGDNVFSSGNLVLDLLHNYFLESGARNNKLRVYEMVKDPVGKALTGYLLVRGGVHQVAYAKALELVTGVEMTKMMPVPHIDTSKIPESKKLMDQNIHLKLYRMSPSDYNDMGEIWKGPHPDDGQEVYVTDELPNGGETKDSGHSSATFAPEYDMDELKEMAAHLMKKGGIKPE